MSHPVSSVPDRALLRYRIADATRRLYLTAVRRFLEWCNDNDITSLTTTDLDHILTDYLHALWRADMTRSPQAALSTRYGLTYLRPDLDAVLPTADAAIRGWQAYRPPVSRPPLTYEAAVAIAATLASRQQLRLAVAVLLSFDCYLRSNEVLHLLATDVLLPATAQSSAFSSPVLRLRRTKTGTNQSVTVRDPAVHRLLSVLIATTPPDQPLFPYTYSQLSKGFNDAATALGLQAVHFTLHSLRHGGATHDYARDVPIEDIMVRGRWQSNSTARIYLQTGRALLIANRIPPAVSRYAQELLQHDLAVQLLQLRLSASSTSCGRERQTIA